MPGLYEKYLGYYKEYNDEFDKAVSAHSPNSATDQQPTLPSTQDINKEESQFKLDDSTCQLDPSSYPPDPTPCKSDTSPATK